MKHRWTIGVCAAALSGLLLGMPSTAAQDEARCIELKLKGAAKHAKQTLGCRAKAAKKAVPVDAACLDKAGAKLEKLFARIEKKGGCPTTGEVELVRGFSGGLAGRASATLAPDSTSRSGCAQKQLKEGARLVQRAAAAYGRHVKKSDLAKLEEQIAKARDAFAKRYEKALSKSDCQNTQGAEFAGPLFEAGLDAIYAQLRIVERETIHVSSSAQPAGTPGTPGVDASSYPSLVTQFGGTAIDLNRATYTRYFARPDGTAPDAVLVLVPGFEGGGSTFQILAENAITRGLEQGLRLEVWAYDRRGNQLEDRAGFVLAAENQDPQLALDWYFGEELGLPLSPELVAGPNRRAIIHDPQAATAFMANWTPLVFSRDIDAIVEAARNTATQNVFLGGHSAGTGFTARYAATDFDLSGSGPPDPGHGKVRGLVLLEGGGGSVPATPPSEDALDRIEDRADGGLFAAVRDDAPRCVDGTPCTLATEAADCAGLGNGTCTEPTVAYAVLPGLLNPRIFAASEPGSLQSGDRADTEQVILQVDQGAPGNTAIAVVPDLGSLGLLPQATAEGALGTFLDDDSFVAALASFVSTSVGEAGPFEGGILTWRSASEGPFAPGAVPDNGPAPTALPADVWGQEKEVTLLSRVALTFSNTTSNFSDWYYPSAGLGTTSGLGLDSSSLSVGRGRPDIENLTQAGTVDVPVIAFGGTNGLTEVPASFLSFAQSLGVCASPSCDGTARVVDALSPSAAFPTFGGPEGGYEVHLSEGFAHVDVVTAEDDGDNRVIGPLLEFIERNLE